MNWFRKLDTPDPALAPMPGEPFAEAPPPVVSETRRRKWLRRISRGFAIFSVIFILR
jgi:penicillin-binding protein 1A